MIITVYLTADDAGSKNVVKFDESQVCRVSFAERLLR